MLRYRKLSFLLCILLCITFLLGMNKPENMEGKKIFKNISVENIDIGGLTYKEALKEINKYYKEKDIIINYDGKSWTLRPDEIELSYNIEKALSEAYDYTETENRFENIKRKTGLIFKGNHNIELKATYNETKLSNFIENICKEIDISVTQASVEIKDSGEIIRTPSKEGKEVQKIKLKEDIYNMICDKKIKSLNLPVKIVNPTITTEDIQSINTVLGQFSTSFNEHNSRGSNIHVAGKSTSDKLIMPYEMFSYNKATGARNWVNGYKSAKVIIGGKYVNGEGGGVCQVSTTIYNAALLSGMRIEEVHNHTMPSRYVPRGRDAAVSYGYTDFKFKNPYSHPIYIKNIVSNGAITSKIYGCSQDREKLYIKTEEKIEKTNIIVKTYRVYLDEENNKIREELIATSKYKLK